MIIVNISVITLVFLVVSGWSPQYQGKLLAFVDFIFSMLMLYMFTLLAYSLTRVAVAGSFDLMLERYLVELVYIAYILIVVYGNILKNKTS